MAPVLLVLTVLATYLASLGESWWIVVSVLGYDARSAMVHRDDMVMSRVAGAQAREEAEG